MTTLTKPGFDRPVESKRDLIAYLERGAKPKSDFGIGTEVEKLVVDSKTGEAADFPRIEKLLERLEESGEWEGIREEGCLVALKGESSSITLEPGGQLELSGALCSDTHCSLEDFNHHNAVAAREAEPLGLTLLGLGVQPFTHRDRIAWLPKARYQVMGPYMLQAGEMGQHMMKKTAGVQINIDFSDEADCIEKLRLAMSLAPLLYALFANSPLMEGRPTGFLSTRGEIWSKTDPDRTGLIPALFRESANYETYVDYALNVPMYFILRNEGYMDMTSRRITFAKFMKEGFETEKATLLDWDVHLSTLFTEARLRPQIEVRSADSLPPNVAPAVEALIKGLFYDKDALEETAKLFKGQDDDVRERLYRKSWRLGLKTEEGKWNLGEMAKEAVKIAETSLKKQGKLDSEGRDESVYLEPLFEISESGVTLAERLLDRWENSGEEKMTILREHCGYPSSS